jgi:cell division protein FtsL
MNEKKDKKEETPKRRTTPKPTTTQAKQSFFARNKSMITIIIAAIIVLIVIVGACWYNHYQLSTLYDSINTTELKLQKIDKEIGELKDNQTIMLSRVEEINNILNENIPPVKEEGEKQITTEKTKTSTALDNLSKHKNVEPSSKIKWYIPLIIVIIVLAIIYVIIMKLRKRES